MKRVSKLDYQTLIIEVVYDGVKAEEYVQILDKILVESPNRHGSQHKYLVLVVGEPANCYKDGKSYKTDYSGEEPVEREIITPNKDKVFLIDPSQIIKIANK